jgi:thiopurine S-methyltransferase
MTDATNTKEQEVFWSTRYSEERTGWDIGAPSTPLKEYIDQLENKDLRILIPGAGNAYEAEYLWQKGFKNTYVLDISAAPLKAFSERVPDFPKEQLIHANFFDYSAEYDLILEQTFFCSFPPLKENRENYAKKMASLLKKGGKLVGLWFNIPLTGDLVKRPFGGDKTEYLTYLSPYFEVLTFEECHNSIKPRLGSELFGIFHKTV